MNAVMLAKLGWKILTDSNNIGVKVVSAKYLNDKHFFEVKKVARASTMWKYILDHRYILKKGLSWITGNGKRINFGYEI